MTNAMKTETTGAVHKFEAAGLGKAPFRVIGFSVEKYQACPGAPIQPAGSCDYCGQGIMNQFRVKGADGATFKVGPDCVAKAGDAGLRRVVDEKMATVRRKQGRAAAAAKISAGDEFMARADVSAWMAETTIGGGLTRHADGSLAIGNQTVASYVGWLLPRCGASGKLRTIKELRLAFEISQLTTEAR